MCIRDSFQDCVIGYGSLGQNTADGKPIAFIPMLAVSEPFQGREVGGKKVSHHILDDLIRSAREQNHERVCLLVNKSNERAIRLYSSFGFSTYGNELKYGNLRMCKKLIDGDSSIS